MAYDQSGGRARRSAPRLPSIAGALPPHDLEAEAAVLSAIMLKPSELEHVTPILRAADFYSMANQYIYETIRVLDLGGDPIDVVQIASRLRDLDRLAQVGGNAYLAQIVDATPAIANVADHARIVARHSRRRAYIAHLHQQVAEAYSAPYRDPDEEGRDEGSRDTWLARSVNALVDVGAQTHRQTTVDRQWQAIPAEWLSTPPAPRAWLLKHPTRNGEACAPGEGDGLLPLGKAGIMSAEGGAGKTLALVQLAISIATGRPWLGHFMIGHHARGGSVLLGLAEEDVEEFHRRIHSVGIALRLTELERQHVLERIAILPLAGHAVGLLQGDRATAGLVETDELRALRRRLRSSGGRWSLIVLDPLARWAGADIEADNNAATRLVQAVESLCEAPGRPTVLVAHHSSKVSRREGGADARGVTAITDGFRWAATLRSVKVGVMLRQTKSNYSAPMPEELHLVRERELGGVLRVQSAGELEHAEQIAQERSQAVQERRASAEEAQVAAASKALIDAAQAMPGIRTRRELVAQVRGRKAIVERALSRLLGAGVIAIDKGGIAIRHPSPSSQAAEPAEQSSWEADHDGF